MPREPRAQVVLVEDHPMFREQLAHLINKQPDMAVCAEADNATDGFAVIKSQQPSLAIIDITLKGSSGLELLKDLRAQGIKVPVVMLSMHADRRPRASPSPKTIAGKPHHQRSAFDRRRSRYVCDREQQGHRLSGRRFRLDQVHETGDQSLSHG